MLKFMLFYLIKMLIYFMWKKNYLNREKNSSFECGFDPLSSSRLPFSIQFYLIGILFLIFDIEVILLFPLVSSLNLLNLKNWFFSVFIILMILYLGLEYEKNEGSLKWYI
uniref:NADH-ubiquinone oxidoreductase chain 3 n=1 Tax=Homolobus sp. QL-2013 TaxID=1421595 RepID=A0A0A6ZL14_9HYME|nr:NADH dehydrogenase subunit 3 [Homolobus sp. QL-2013]